jgi:hypothetical protein
MQVLPGDIPTHLTGQLTPDPDAAAAAAPWHHWPGPAEWVSTAAQQGYSPIPVDPNFTLPLTIVQLSNVQLDHCHDTASSCRSIIMMLHHLAGVPSQCHIVL